MRWKIIPYDQDHFDVVATPDMNDNILNQLKEDGLDVTIISRDVELWDDLRQEKFVAEARIRVHAHEIRVITSIMRAFISPGKLQIY